jgi:cytochrome c oxidase assembly protein subunit 11
MTAVSHPNANRRTAFIFAIIGLGMLALAFASVPLYRLFCQVTGFGGTTQRMAVGTSEPVPVPGKSVSVRFDGNIGGGLPWLFRPEQQTQTVTIGDRRLAFFRATNNSDKPITGSAGYNVSPDEAGRYFVKIECFCFQEQTLQPGESVDMPVTYYVDPAILDDATAGKISEITLSYTFYPVNRQSSAAVEGGKTKG